VFIRFGAKKLRITGLAKSLTAGYIVSVTRQHSNVNININVVYALKQKFSEDGVGLCEEMGDQPVSELFTTDGDGADGGV